MASLPEYAAQYLQQLRREEASEHTIRAYGSDLRQMILTISDPEPPPIAELTRVQLRVWLAKLNEQGLDNVSIRRKLAAARSFLDFLCCEKVIRNNRARGLFSPRAAKRLPEMISEERAAGMLDSKPEGFRSAWPSRDAAMLELLYGSGIRSGELVKINLGDIDLLQRWVRIQGKGKRQRMCPFGTAAAEAVDFYLNERKRIAKEEALFLNRRGRRITTRALQDIVRIWAVLKLGDASIHPHTFRHAFATHMLSNGADLRAVQEMLGHVKLSSTQKYTHLSIDDLAAVYDRCHPKA